MNDRKRSLADTKEAPAAPFVLSATQQQVIDAIDAKSNVFFTGAAGTGKSKLLEYLIKTHLAGRKGVYTTASTGIAAINIGGTTLHAFAGCGLAEGPVEVLAYKLGRDARHRWTTCEVLIIDEISMLPMELFDKFEALARLVRSKNQPFGGIQLVIAGDFLQLPPVKAGEQPFCFQSKVWEECISQTICLETVFRQTHAPFIKILGEVREGVLSDDGFEMLLKTANRDLSNSAHGVKPTLLYARNQDVNQENARELGRLPGESVIFKAKDVGKEPHLTNLRKNCQAAETLELKVGAQVMLLKNLSPCLVNGSRGIVESFRKGGPLVFFPDLGFPVLIESAAFEIREAEQVVASRKQVPLRLAWALTIHKCQGMTLPQAIVDLTGVFEYGQVYVALSRVQTIEGLQVIGLTPAGVKAHPAAIEFYSYCSGSEYSGSIEK